MVFPRGRGAADPAPRFDEDPWATGIAQAEYQVEVEADDPLLPAWKRDHEAMIGELHRELAENLPTGSHFEFCFGVDGRQGRIMQGVGCPPVDPARRKQHLTPVDIRLGPVDPEMLEALITAGTAASRAEAIGCVLARIRERPAYTRLSERARELDELRAQF